MRIIGFMMIITLPILCIIQVVFLVLCLPFIVMHAAAQEFYRCCKELFDLRNTYAFAAGIASKAYKFMKPEGATQ